VRVKASDLQVSLSPFASDIQLDTWIEIGIEAYLGGHIHYDRLWDGIQHAETIVGSDRVKQSLARLKISKELPVKSHKKYDDISPKIAMIPLEDKSRFEGHTPMATGTEYISSYARKYTHMRYMLHKLWDLTQAMPDRRFDADGTFKYDANAIAEYIKSRFSPVEINEAHIRAKAEIPNRGPGRHKGARNKNKVMQQSPNGATPNVQLPVTPFDDMPANEAEAAQAAAPVMQIAQAAPIQAHDHIDLTKYVLKQDFELNVRRVNNDLHNITMDVSTLTDDHRALKLRVDSIIENRPTVVTLERRELPPINLGVQHKHFPELLIMCNAALRGDGRNNIWIYGPAGTGKTTAASMVAKAMSLPFYAMSALETGFQVIGYMDANGNYVTTLFRQAWEHGGVIILDEVDSYQPSAALALNGALANSHCSFADKIVPRHKDCIIIAGANTTGLGGTLEYSGRMKQDAAFNDRWCFLDWPLDEALEDALCANKEWVAIVRKVRANVIAKQMKGVMVTPRATIYGESLLAAGLPLERVIKSVIYKGMTEAQIAMVRP